MSYLYIYTASGWVGVGWFGPKRVSTYADISGHQNAKEQGVRRVGRNGWLYVYDDNGSGNMYRTDSNGFLWL
jgi:hypothetical protein